MADVKVISDTVQEFNGEKFYLCGNYFQHNGKRLHRAVWEYHNGKIPKGYDIHHVDENKANNSIDNLTMLTESEHLKLHTREESRRENGRQAIKLAIEKAPEWHKSEDGKKWHSENAKKNWQKRREKEPYTYTCTMCGKEFQTYYIYPEGMNHFCNPNCKAKHLRLRRKGLA